MEPYTTFLIMACVIGFALITIALDRILHNRERQNFALGTMISALAFCGMVILVASHPNISGKAFVLILFALIVIGLAGNLLIDKNNIDDQESGRMSKYGTWWDGWNNGYVFNVIDKWETWGMIFLVGCLMVNVAMNNEPSESAEAKAIPQPKSSVKATPAVDKSAKHSAHPAHSRAPQKHHAAQKGQRATAKHQF